MFGVIFYKSIDMNVDTGFIFHSLKALIKSKHRVDVVFG